LRVDGDPAEVGRLAHAAGVPLARLGAAGGAGLEEMFLAHTADTQRETTPRTTTARTRGAAA
jgi:ABC-2 type transport system ATP-binding protein